MNKTMKIDIGDLCTYCGKDTSFGSGLFVNRIPSGANGKLLLQRGQEVLEEESDIDAGSGIDGNLLFDTLIDVEVDGYMCPDCQRIECDECGELTLEYELVDGEIPIPDGQRNWAYQLQLCPDCMEKREVTDD